MICRTKIRTVWFLDVPYHTAEEVASIAWP